MTRVVVTGGSGKAGRATVRDLVAHGYEVVNADQVESVNPVVPFVRVDLTDAEQTLDVLRGADGVVHLAAIPTPRGEWDEETVRNNLMSTYNIFGAAAQLGLKRVVWASSETVLGLPFDRALPDYAPIDEEQPPRPETGYALAKMLCEQMAQQFARWTGMSLIGLRFSNIMEPERYQQFPGFWKDPLARRWNLWGYVDARDVAQSCRLSLEAGIAGSEVFIIAAADTVMTQPNGELMAAVFPSVPLREGTGDHSTLLSIDKARRLLGYAPRYSWRDHVSG